MLATGPISPPTRGTIWVAAHQSEVAPLNDMGKNLLLWLVIAAVLLTVFNNFSPKTTSQELLYSQFVEAVQRDRVREVVIDGLVISGEFRDGDHFETVRPQVDDPKLMDDLIAHGVSVQGARPEQQSLWGQLLVASFPILVIIAVFMSLCAKCKAAPAVGAAP